MSGTRAQALSVIGNALVPKLWRASPEPRPQRRGGALLLALISEQAILGLDHLKQFASLVAGSVQLELEAALVRTKFLSQVA